MQQSGLAAIDPVAWRRRRDQFPAEALEPYRGQQVAWSADGAGVVASAPTHEELYDLLDARGIGVSQVVVEFIPDPGTSYR